VCFRCGVCWLKNWRCLAFSICVSRKLRRLQRFVCIVFFAIVQTVLFHNVIPRVCSTAFCGLSFGKSLDSSRIVSARIAFTSSAVCCLAHPTSVNVLCSCKLFACARWPAANGRPALDQNAMLKIWQFSFYHAGSFLMRLAKHTQHTGFRFSLIDMHKCSAVRLSLLRINRLFPAVNHLIVTNFWQL
jgi:hypothetical protein